MKKNKVLVTESENLSEETKKKKLENLERPTVKSRL